MADVPLLCGTFLVVIFMCVYISLAANVDLTKEDEPEERECHGTKVGFGYSGTLEMHYHNMRRRYAGCTYITGNLEVTNLVDPNIEYDLSFLKTIRYVSGAVLVGLITEVEEIPLVNLEVIRGNQTYHLQGDDYSLVVVITSRGLDDTFGLKELQMPKLKEISQGKVLLKKNPALGFVNTVDWEPIVGGRIDDVHFMENACNYSVANMTDPSVCYDGCRWGRHPSLCQEVEEYIPCHETCSGRCFGEAAEECCDGACAVGCLGGGPMDCFMCKDYSYDGSCVDFCPAKSYPKNQECVKYDDE